MLSCCSLEKWESPPPNDTRALLEHVAADVKTIFFWSAITVTMPAHCVLRIKSVRTVHVFMTLKSRCILLTSCTKTNWHPANPRVAQLPTRQLLHPQTRVSTVLFCVSFKQQFLPTIVSCYGTVGFKFVCSNLSLVYATAQCCVCEVGAQLWRHVY